MRLSVSIVMRTYDLGRIIWILLLLNMVAEAYAAKGSKDTTGTMNVSKSFAYTIKLNRENFSMWLTGLLATMMGLRMTPKVRWAKHILTNFSEQTRGGEEAFTKWIKGIEYDKDGAASPSAKLPAMQICAYKMQRKMLSTLMRQETVRSTWRSRRPTRCGSRQPREIPGRTLSCGRRGYAEPHLQL